MKPQCAQLLTALRRRPLTSLEIHAELGIYRASARIYDLRDGGERIATDLVSVKNRDGEACRVARYALLRTDDPNLDLWDDETARVAA